MLEQRQKSREPVPYLSIVVPAYNKENQIGRLVESALSRNGVGDHEVELIVVDDASSDGTHRVVSNLAKGDARLRLFRLPMNSGVHAARNAGMSAAKGRWVGFLDGDDYLVEDGLGAILSSLRHLEKDFEIVFFPFNTSDDGMRTGYVKEGEYDIRSILSGKVFRKNKGCIGFVQRPLIERCAASWYYTNLDFLFWRELEFNATGQKIYFRDQVVGIYDRGTEGSLGKQRRKRDYIARHADSKVEAMTSFLTRMQAQLSPYKEYSRMLFESLLKDVRFSRRAGRYLGIHFRLARKYGVSPGYLIKYLGVFAFLNPGILGGVRSAIEALSRLRMRRIPTQALDNR